MGRHSRKGRAPKGDTTDIKTGVTADDRADNRADIRTARTDASTGPGARPSAARPQAQPPQGAAAPRRYEAPGYGRTPGQAAFGQGARFPDGTPAHGFPRLPDGTPAHGVPRFADGTPAHGFPRVPDGVQARGFPPGRGEHPEQREAGGGWGHLGGAGRRQGAGPGVAPGAPGGPPYGGPGEASPHGAPHGVPPESSGRRIPIPRQRQETMPPGGPRQAYLDAFDEVDDIFTPGRTHRGAPGVDDDGRAETALEEKPPRRRSSRQGVSGQGQAQGASQGASQGSSEQPPGGEAEAEVAGTAKGGKGRAFVGIAAAAVTTVLVVVVGGQMAVGEDDTAARPQAADAGERAVREASRSDNRPTPSVPPSPSATPLTYEQKMDQKFALAADLEGGGKFEAVGGFDRAPGAGQKYRYRVDVEKGLGLDAELFADAVQKTLNDERSWAHGGGRTFERISSGTPDFVITLASPGTTAFWCAKSGLDTTVDNVSCDSAATERVMINAYRWAQGSETYGDEIHAYRQMLINHEIGHRLKYPHVTCDKDGELAPVMQQQSKFLTYGGITCKANPWPYPGS
ncbi:DUF3152 domain-containing protein [Streptomyces sp. NPDC051773]|uniref:DUF3152 domain-containing protein n=1 Tax=Streptomyces sp. NPDC051773 TaxID=3156682 RepID=UPI003422BAFC